MPVPINEAMNHLQGGCSNNRKFSLHRQEPRKFQLGTGTDKSLRLLGKIQFSTAKKGLRHNLEAPKNASKVFALCRPGSFERRRLERSVEKPHKRDHGCEKC